MIPPPPVGAMFLRHIPGPAGRWISAMQALVRGGSFWTHAGLIVDGGWYVQGEPGGAKPYPVGTLSDNGPLLISDAPIQQYLTATGSTPVAEAEVRANVAAAGRSLIGTPYSFLDYVAIGAVEFGWPGHQRIEKYVASSGHLICSALVDRAYLLAGIHLFDDKRPEGDVTPEDLAQYDGVWRGLQRTIRERNHRP